MKAFPLQHKKMQRLTMPYVQVGTCEVMNLATSYNMDSFNVLNHKNRSFYSDRSRGTSTAHAAPASAGAAAPSPTPPAFLGDVVGGGLLDSYAGREASSFVRGYLARALSRHTVVPAELRAMRKEDPTNPLLDLMMAGLRRRNGMGVSDVSSVVAEWDMQQYAICADAAFFNACQVQRRRGSTVPGPTKAHFTSAGAGPEEGGGGGDGGEGEEGRARSLPAEETGCRGVWFSATVAPTSVEAEQRRALVERREQLAPPPQKTLQSAEALQEKRIQQLVAQSPICLDVLVGGVGSSRAFGVARNALTDGTSSLLDPSRERTVALSMDHIPLRTTEYRRIIQAGGKVDSAVGNIIDGNPFMNVSRSFGHWSMKRNPHRSPAEQKLIAVPTVMPWRMLEGDALVLCNHAVFETRHEDDSSMDELAKLVGRGLSAGLSADAIAASLCDFAVRFGAEHSLQVMVVVATKPTEEAMRDGSASTTVPDFAEWIDPGPLYVGACQQLPGLRRALELDCARCDVTVATLVRERWRRVRDLLPLRHTLSLLPYYGKECGALQQVMDEEALFFDDEALKNVADVMDPALDPVFQTLAKRLMTGLTRSGAAK